MLICPEVMVSFIFVFGIEEILTSTYGIIVLYNPIFVKYCEDNKQASLKGMIAVLIWCKPLLYLLIAIGYSIYNIDKWVYNQRIDSVVPQAENYKNYFKKLTRNFVDQDKTKSPCSICH